MGADPTWTVSSVNGAQRGRTLTSWHSNIYQSNERDNQVCECRASDGFEIQGGTVDYVPAPGGGDGTGAMFNLPGGQETASEYRFNLLLETKACRNHGTMLLRGTDDFAIGTDSFRLNGLVEVPPGIINESPATGGAWLYIRDASGLVLHKIGIPSGYFNPTTGKGWTIRQDSPTLARWTYNATAANAVSGIRKVRVVILGDKMSFTVVGSDSGYIIPFARTPLRVELVMQDTPQARDAACAELTLNNCARTATPSDFVCRRRRGDKQ